MTSQAPYAPGREPTAAAAKALLDRIGAVPRAAGSAAEQRARELCALRLQASGFAPREAPFMYSAFPGRWATPLAGLIALGAILASGHFGAHGHPHRALLVLLLGILALLLLVRWTSRGAVLGAPLLQRRAVNLFATRGVGWPRVWLVAHIDSKSQPVPIGVRVASIVTTVLAILALLALAAGALAGAPWARTGAPAWLAITILGAAASLPIVASVVGDASPGALDNASGVVSVLLAAEALPANTSVGVLLTSAEELGLAGARAWAQKLGRARSRTLTREEPPAIAINCDGVDDSGVLTVMRVRGGRHVTDALAQAAKAEHVTVNVRRMLPGLLVDAVALAAEGWQAATVSRGTTGTLMRIHTRGDTARRMNGEGIAEAARVMARAASALSRLG